MNSNIEDDIMDPVMQCTTDKSKSKGFSKLKGTEDNSSGPYHDGRVKSVISRAPIGSLKQECHVAMKKAQGKGYFALILLSKEAQAVSITDCHAGNPCELSYDPRAKIKAPIIGRMNGRD
ncbi:hypothetical protein Tco_1528829 [Tanacetum coccineum]